MKHGAIVVVQASRLHDSTTIEEVRASLSRQSRRATPERPHHKGARFGLLASGGPSMKGDVKSTPFPASVSLVLTSESPRLRLRRAVPEPVKNLCDSTLFNTVCCLLRPNASSFCERWILRLRKPCADHASIWGSRPIAISGRARGHSLRPGPWWPRIPLILSLDLFCRIVCHTTWGGSADRSPG